VNEFGFKFIILSYRWLFVYGLNDKFLVIERNIPYLTPGKSNLRCQPVKKQGYWHGTVHWMYNKTLRL